MAQLKDLLVNGSARVIGSLFANLSGNVLNFGVCSTAAATAAKTVTTNGTFELITGSKILVLFSETDSSNAPTLNVNGTGAKSIKINASDGIGKGFLVAQQYYWFVYDGTNWRTAGAGITQIIPTQYGGTGNSSFTANRVIYSNTATKLASGSITTDGNYLSNISYLSVNTGHQTSYKLYVNGNTLITGGLLKITNNNNTLTIGSYNPSFTHIYNSANIAFILNNSLLTTTGNLGSETYPWNNLYIGKTGTKNIYYVGSKATNSMIRFLDNTSDAYGNGISIGGGGAVVIGAGESAISMSVSADTETLYLLSDGAINVEAHGDTIANRIGFQVDTSGNIIPVKAETGNNNVQNIGSSSYKWANIYATTLNGNLAKKLTIQANGVQKGQFNNSADVTVNLGNVVQDFTGANSGNAASINADTFAGMTRQQWLNTVYPIGSIYMSVSATSPATLFGGTWESLGGRFLIGQDGTYTAGSTGGEASHTLTLAEAPAHTHSRGTMNITGYFIMDPSKGYIRVHTASGAFYSSGSGARADGGSSEGSYPIQANFDASRTWSGETDSKGGGSAHNNMPPYLAVYMWKRTA